MILRNLRIRPWRFNELQRDVDGISQKVLTDSLRQMIDDGLAYRHDYKQNPPKVKYGLTKLGAEMMAIIDALADFVHCLSHRSDCVLTSEVPASKTYIHKPDSAALNDVFEPPAWDTGIISDGNTGILSRFFLFVRIENSLK